MNLGNTIRNGAAWLFIGNTSSQVLGFLVGIVLARLLAPADFGMLVTIQVFTGIAGLVAGGGMGQALVYAKEISQKDYDTVFALQLLIGCLIYSIFFFTAPWFARWYDTPIYADLLRVSSLSFIIRPFNNLPVSILHRNMRFKALTGVKIYTILASSLVSISMAYMGFGVWSLIIGGIVGSITSIFVFMVTANWKPGFSLDIRRARDIARYGLLVNITDILVYFRSQASIFILSRTLGPASVGLYNKGDSLAKMPHSFITGSVYQVLFRAMAAEQDNLDKCQYLYFRSISLVAVYATPFYVGFLWLGEPLIRGLYGSKWIEAALPLTILALAWPFWLIDNLSGAVLAAKNWLNREVPVQVSTFVIVSLAVLIGLPHGIKGVAYAIVCASIYSAIYMYWLAISSLKAKYTKFISALIPAGILNILLAGMLFLIDRILPNSLRANDITYVFLMGMIGGFVYVLCFLFLPIPSLLAEQERWKSKFRFIVSAITKRLSLNGHD
jgi:O-antigen/teichoic acid export membrane protein